MRKATSLILFLLSLSAAGPIATAGAASQPKPAATDQLPAALRALAPAPHEMLSAAEAAEVRGQWLLTLDLPFIAARIQGQGKFDLNLMTVSTGVLVGRPVMVGITVGNRQTVIQAPRSPVPVR